MQWYHATITERLESILSEGLKPKSESPGRDYPPRIYLSKSAGLCMEFAKAYNERAEDGVEGYVERSFSLLTVWLSDKMDKELIPDPETGHDGVYLEGRDIPAGRVALAWHL